MHELIKEIDWLIVCLLLAFLMKVVGENIEGEVEKR